MAIVEFGALAGLLLAAAPPAAPVDPLFRSWASPASPGCAVTVAQDGRLLVDRAYGSADLEHDVPNRASTIFEAGSVAKQFTAAAILMLAEEGKLALGDDVRKHVPELPDYGDVITIDHLLSHRSGLRDWGVVAEVEGWPRGSRAHTNWDAFEIASRQRSLNHRPGAEYSYTNTGYNLLAVIVERLSGKSLADYTRERLFEPLGMRSTGWRDEFRRIVKNRAVGYEKQGGEWLQAMPFENAYGNGGLLTTTGDLIVWNEALTAGKLGAFVTAKLGEQATIAGSRRIAYARGLSVSRYGGTTEIAHSGSTGGYRAWLARYPERKLSVALLCNAGDADGLTLGRRVADLFLPPAPVATAPARLESRAAERAGLYVSERSGRTLRLVAERGKLRLAGGPVLAPTAPDAVTFEGNDLLFTANGFTLTSDGDSIRFMRQQEWKPAAAELEAFTGSYVSLEAAARYIALVEDRKLVLRNARRPQQALALTPAYQDAFEFEAGIVRFHRGPDGAVAELGIGVPRVRDLRFAKEAAPR